MNQEIVEAAQDAAEAAVSAKGLGSTLTGGAVALYGGLSANDWAVFIGVMVGIFGLVVQVYTQYYAYKERKERMRVLAEKEKRDVLKHQLWMQEYERHGRALTWEESDLEELPRTRYVEGS